MIHVRGFCDLNVCSNGETKTSLKNTCQALLDLGYRAVAINSMFSGSVFDVKKKKKKGEMQEKGDVVPTPANQDLIKNEIIYYKTETWLRGLSSQFQRFRALLQNWRQDCRKCYLEEALSLVLLAILTLQEEFKGKLDIYERLTVSISTQLQAHKLSQSVNAKMYNILAVIPTTQVAFQYACSAMDVDLITFDPDDIGLVKCSRKMYNVAVDRGLSFEIMYTPAVRDSTARKNIIQLGHFYHAFGKSKHIIISSGAADPFHIRGPYDVINLGLLFGLSEEQSKGAITTACRFLLIKAAGRRLGKTIVIANKDVNMSNEPDGSDVIEKDEMDQDLEEPVQKKLRQDCPERSVATNVDT